MLYRWFIITAFTCSSANGGMLCVSEWRQFLGDQVTALRAETGSIQWALGGIEAKVENSVWKNEKHREMGKRIVHLLAETAGREPSAVKKVDEKRRSIPQATADEVLANIQGLGGAAHLDIDGELTGAKNLIVIDAIPPSWKGSHLETTFLAARAFGGDFAIDPQTREVYNAEGIFYLHGNGTIVSPFPPFSEYTALHEIRHLIDYHDPEHWTEAIKITEGSTTTSLRENERRLAEQKASKDVLHHIVLQKLLGSASAEAAPDLADAQMRNRFNLANYKYDLVLKLLRDGKYYEAYTKAFDPAERGMIKIMGGLAGLLAAGYAWLWWA